jgi:hypothetical protein
MLGQLYPVQVIPQIIPPYSNKLVEYTDSSVNRMQLQMVTTDLTVINRPVYLKMYIEGNGIKAQSRDLIQGVQPLFINGGDILSLSGMELAPYFQLRNLDGISQNTYANLLPDGMYSICYEVYDLVTRKRLSQKSCAHMYLVLNDPPILNLPLDKDKVLENDFTNIVFSWTPRQINALNVSYTFEIKELRDPNVSGPYAFDLGLPVHKVTDIRSTTLLYDQLMPTLVAGKRYGWRVKATSFSGLAANSVFKNDGYSEVRSFTLTKDCGAPSGILPLPNGSNAIKLNWQGAPTHLKYHVQYRKEGVVGAEWFDRYVLNNHTIITDLEPGFTYEFRVGGTCEAEVYPAQPNYSYSEIVRYEIKQSKDKDKDFSCGLKADTKITNHEPMVNLVVNESFYAGDFTVKILNLEGTGSSVYTGVGSIYVPYLGITLAVEFKNIQINTDYQLISGVVETAYDKNWENVKNPNEQNKKESLYEEVEFEIKEITVDSEGNPKLVGTNGEQKILEKNKDYTIVDGADKEWTIPSDFDGKEPITEPTGVKAKTGVPKPENTNGVGKDGQVTEFSAKELRISFENASDAVYAFDNASGASASSKYGALYKKVKAEYLPYKAVENGKTDKVIARVKFTGEAVKLDSLSLDFKTSAGSAIAFVKNSDTEYELTVKGSFKYAEDQIMAVYKPEGEEKYVVAGAMQLIHLNAITLPLKIVPTSKTVDAEKLKQELIKIYSRSGVTVKADVLDLYADGQLDVSEVSKDDKKFLSSYTPSEQKFIEQYFSSHDQEAAFYLFVSNKEGGLKGRMPIQSQFGFVSDPDGMTSMALTAAHELGHGAFELQHPFTQYSTTGGAANSMMDIPPGVDFNQVDWKQMNMRKFSLKTVIQNKGDGALQGAVWINPLGKPFKLDGSLEEANNEYIMTDGQMVKNGAVRGFSVYNKDNRVIYRWVNKDGKKGYYSESGGVLVVHSSYKELDESTLDNNTKVNLYHANGGCDKDEHFTTTYGYVKKVFNTPEGFNFRLLEGKIAEDKNLKYVGVFTCRDKSNNDIVTKSGEFFGETKLPSIKDYRYVRSTELEDKDVAPFIKGLKELLGRSTKPYNYKENKQLTSLSNIYIESDVAAKIEGKAMERLLRLDHKLRYLKDFSIEKGKKVEIYVVVKNVDYVLSNPIDWNEMADRVIKSAEVSDKNIILITVPYYFFDVKYGLGDSFKIDYCSPGISIPSSLKVDKKSIELEAPVHNSNLGGYLYHSMNQVTNFIEKVYIHSEKPLRYYTGRLFADGSVINIQKHDSSKYKTGVNGVKEIVTYKHRNYDEVLKIDMLIKGLVDNLKNEKLDKTLKETTSNGKGIRELLFSHQYQRIQLIANSGNDIEKDYSVYDYKFEIQEDVIDEVSNNFINYYAFRSLEGQKGRDLELLFNLQKGNFSKSDVYNFKEVVQDKYVYGAVDAASIGLSFAGADVVADVAGMLYAIYRDDAGNITIYATASVFSGVNSSTVRLINQVKKLPKDVAFSLNGKFFKNNGGVLEEVSTNQSVINNMFGLKEKSLPDDIYTLLHSDLQNKNIKESVLQEIISSNSEKKRIELILSNYSKKLDDLFTKFPNLRNGYNGLSDDLKKVFLRDIDDMGEDAFKMMHDNPKSFEIWKNFRTKLEDVKPCK